jgi:type IV pilus assembly protein PilV
MTHIADRKGYTLLEVLAAILIFAFGIMALYRVQVGSINTNSFSNDVSQATRYAQDKIDYLMGLDLTHADLADTNGDSAGQDLNNNGKDDDEEGTAHDGVSAFGLNNHTTATADRYTAVPGTKYTVFWNVAVDQPMAGSRTIRVLVQWTDKRNVAHLISLDAVKGTHY